MSRGSKLIKLALGKSERSTGRGTDAGENDNASDNILTKENPPPLFLETGRDLLYFKYNLRQRCPEKIQDEVNERISVSKESEEFFSAIVSEYMPSEDRVSSVLAPGGACTELINDERAEIIYDEEYYNSLTQALGEIRQNTDTVLESENHTNNRRRAKKETLTNEQELPVTNTTILYTNTTIYHEYYTNLPHQNGSQHKTSSDSD